MKDRRLIMEFEHNNWDIKVLTGMFSEAYMVVKKDDIVYETNTSVKYDNKNKEELREVVIKYLFEFVEIDKIIAHKKLIDNAPAGSKVIIRHEVYDLEEARNLIDGNELIYPPVIVKPGEVKYLGIYVDPYGSDYTWGVFDTSEEAEVYKPQSYGSGELMYLQNLEKIAP